VLVRQTVALLKRRYQHKEEIARINKELRVAELKHEEALTGLRLKVLEAGRERAITEQELAQLAEQS
jgi:hypothetical protein